MNSHIAIYLPSLRGGGAERVMVFLANGFAKRGLRVDLVLAKAEGPYLKDVAENVRIVDLGVSRVLKSLPRLCFYLRREKPSVVLSALTHANIVAVVSRILSLSNMKIFLTEHNDVFQINHKKLNLWSSLKFAGVKYVYFLSDGIIAVSEGLKKSLENCLNIKNKKIEVIHNPIVGEYLRERSFYDLNHPWFKPGEPPVVLGVGRLTQQKDFGLLIRAFKKSLNMRKARLIVLGEGELRSGLEDLVRSLGIEGEVSLPGFVDNPYVYMRNAALFVLSSRWEGFGNVLVEAMACGAPVVSTNCPSGPAEILEGGRWGRLVPVGDVNAMADAMVATLDDVVQPDVVKRAADFNIEQAVDRYLRVLGILA